MLEMTRQDKDESCDTMPTLSVTVAFSRGEWCVLDCLASLRGLDYPPDRLEIIAVDDGQDDELAGEIRRRFPGIILLRNRARQGCDGSKQLGIDAACGNLIALTDADCTVGRSWARAIAKNLMDGWDVVTGPVRHPRSIVREAIGVADFQDFQSYRRHAVRAFPGCNVSARREVLAATRYLRSGSTRFGSDRLVSWSMHISGLRMAYEPEMEVHHSPADSLAEVLERRFRYGRKAWALRVADPTLPGGFITKLGPLSIPAYLLYKVPKDVRHLFGMSLRRIVSPLHLPLLLVILPVFRMLDALGMLSAQLHRPITAPARRMR